MTDLTSELLTVQREQPVALPWEVYAPFSTMDDRIRRRPGGGHVAAIVCPNYINPRSGFFWSAWSPDGSLLVEAGWAPSHEVAMQEADAALRVAGWLLGRGPTKPYRDPLSTA